MNKALQCKSLFMTVVDFSDMAKIILTQKSHVNPVQPFEPFREIPKISLTGASSLHFSGDYYLFSWFCCTHDFFP